MWRVAKSLEVLLHQLNELYPTRSKVSDGSIGDQKHSARTSDHNPNRFNVVRARDFTHDPTTLDGNKLLTALLADKDWRIKYIIFNKKIYNSKNSFDAKPYTGTNAHAHHLHLSVSDLPLKYDDDSPWVLAFTPNETTGTTEHSVMVTGSDQQTAELSRGAKGQSVRCLQGKLVDRHYLKITDIDGDFGTKTMVALQRFQLENSLTADGIAGGKTNKLLGL